MNIDTLRRRIDRAIVAVERTRPKPESGYLDTSLLMPCEQDEFAFFLSTLPQPIDPQACTKQQIDTMRYWLGLIHALQDGDQDKASHVRRCMRTSTEQLIAMFLALDLTRLPDDYNKPDIEIIEGHCIYHLSRGNHRYVVINNIPRYRATGELPLHEQEDMWRWIRYYEQHFTQQDNEKDQAG